jgi:phosphohistidine swiveling domain-containing protein
MPAWVTLRRLGSWPGAEAMGVIVQSQVAARVAGVALSRDPHDEEQLRVEVVVGLGDGLADGTRDPRCLLLPRDEALRAAPPGSPLSVEVLRQLRSAVLGLEGGSRRTVEVEWAYDGTSLWLLQARPWRGVAGELSFPLVWRRPVERLLVWRWDREHNPEPLSPAHASLVQLLEEQQQTPRQLVQGGYLYSAVVAEQPAETEPLAEVWSELRQRLEEQLAAFARDEDQARRHPLPHVQAALQFISAFHRSYFGRLADARRAARARLWRLLDRLGVGGSRDLRVDVTLGGAHSTLQSAEELFRLSRLVRDSEALRRFLADDAPALDAAPSVAFIEGARRYLSRFGSLAAAWDVAAPPLSEKLTPLWRRVLALADVDEDPTEAAERTRRRAEELTDALVREVPAGDRGELLDALALARLARQIEEEDDLHFSRALGVLRAALLHAGASFSARHWLRAREEVFLLSIPTVLHTLAQGRPDGDLTAAAERARCSWEHGRRLVPPLTIEGERLTWPTPPRGSGVLRGLGIGGVVHARVRLMASLEGLLAAPLEGAVVVCPTLLPALAVILPEIAGLVTDHGGLLSHAACLARELGKTAVVGTGSATRELHDGDMVWIDGTRGLVVRE